MSLTRHLWHSTVIFVYFVWSIILYLLNACIYLEVKKSKCQICHCRTGKEVTYRLGGLNRARGEGVSTAAALGAEVRGGGGGVVDVGQNVMVSALLLCSVRVVTIGGRSACKWTICEQKEKEEYS